MNKVFVNFNALIIDLICVDICLHLADWIWLLYVTDHTEIPATFGVSIAVAEDDIESSSIDIQNEAESGPNGEVGAMAASLSLGRSAFRFQTLYIVHS